MPRFGANGRIVAGVAGTVMSVDAVTPPTFTGIPSGGWTWLNANEVFGQADIALTNVFSLYKYHTGTATLTLLDPDGANEAWSGSNVWAAWLGVPASNPKSGVRTSIASMGVKQQAGLGHVSFAGQIVLVTNRATGQGLDVYSNTGTKIASVSAMVGLPTIRLHNNILCYFDDPLEWMFFSVTSNSHVAFAQRVPGSTTVVRTLPAGSTRMVVLEHEVLASTDRLFVRLALSNQGYDVAGGGNVFFPDIVEIGSGLFRIVWSHTLGESPGDLRTAELNINNGQVRYGMPSPGAPGAVNNFLYGPPSILPLLTVETQIVGGSSLSSLKAVLEHPVVDPKTELRMTLPWAGYIRELDGLITRGFPVGNLQGILQQAQGGTGVTTGLTQLDASNLTSGTVPQARKWTEVELTLVGTQHDVNFNDVDSILANAATPLRITGLVAGVPGQRLMIAATGAADVTLALQDVGSSPGNRIITNIIGDLPLTAGSGMALLSYDGVAFRWRVLAAVSSAVIGQTGYWSPLVTGDFINPELVFDSEGDTIAVFTPLP